MSAFSQPIAQLSVEEFAQRQAEPQLQLVDVREPEELAIAQLDGFINLPLSQANRWSAQMCQWLINQGFTNVKNLAGGIDAYSQAIDPSVPQY